MKDKVIRMIVKDTKVGMEYSYPPFIDTMELTVHLPIYIAEELQNLVKKLQIKGKLPDNMSKESFIISQALSELFDYIEKNKNV